jgi:hypothetical protein
MQAVRAAYRFWAVSWRPTIGALLVVSGLSAMQSYWTLTERQGLSWLASLFTVLASVIAAGALYRRAFVDEHPGDPEFAPRPYGLQWSRTETKLLLLELLLLLLAVLAVLAFVIVAMIALAAIGMSAGSLEAADTPARLVAALGPGRASALLVFVLAALLGALYIGVRLSLAAPATVSEQHVLLLETWRLTKGSFWRMLAAYLLVYAPTIAAGVAVGLLTESAGVAEGDGPTRLPTAIAAGVAVVGGLIGGLIQLPLTAGLRAYLYRGLRDPAIQARPGRIVR